MTDADHNRGKRDGAGQQRFSQPLLNRKALSRDYIVKQKLTTTQSIVQGKWKYIEPSSAMAYNKNTNTESGNSKSPQLYDISVDLGEKNNLAEKYPEVTEMLKEFLEKVKKNK